MMDQPLTLSDQTQPASGFWRRIRLLPSPGVIRAGLEDDFHCFLMEMTHSYSEITALETRSERIPWSTCADAGAFLAKEIVGQPLSVVAEFDPHNHCTHLFELAVLCAAHANDLEPTQFDVRVPDRIMGRTSPVLQKNGRDALYWHLNGTLIEGPYNWTGRDLRELSKWKYLLNTTNREHAMLLRRAVHLSGGRHSQHLNIERASDRGPSRMGACFTYQMPRALNALRVPDWIRDFSQSDTTPLQNFFPDIFDAAARDLS